MLRRVRGRVAWAVFGWVVWGSGCSFDSAGVTSSGASGSGGSTTHIGGTTESDEELDTTIDPTAGTGTSTTGTTTSATTVEATGSDGPDATTTGADACAVDNGGCDPNAECVDIGGQVECACKPGWEGDGLACASNASLETLRIENPCVGTTTTCNTTACTSAAPMKDTKTFEGTPGVVYAATLRIRGVVEEKSYSGGVATGHWYEGGTPEGDPWNVYWLEMGGTDHHLNAGDSWNLVCVGLDYQHTINVEGGTTLSLSSADPDGCQIRNRNSFGQPIFVPGIPPAPGTFDGQFLQIDLVSAEPVP